MVLDFFIRSVSAEDPSALAGLTLYVVWSRGPKKVETRRRSQVSDGGAVKFDEKYQITTIFEIDEETKAFTH
jgi:hypothetical protein